MTRNHRRGFPTLVTALAVLVAGGSQVLVAQAAGAQAAGRLKQVPPLVSEALRPVPPKLPAGDFSNPPSAASERARPSTKDSFDRARSTPLDAETTATRRTWRNVDGSFTTEVSARPVRYRDASGTWKDLDLALAPAEGALAAKAAPAAARLGASAVGALATVNTPAGPVTLRHPDALPVAAATAGGTASYVKALPGGRDVSIEVTPDGFKETVVLASAAAGPTYSEQLALPAGATARQGATGVELLDSSGAPIATYGGGVATDATFAKTGPLAATDVSVRLASAAAGVATVEVSVDPKWLADPARVFPVRIDPVFTQSSAATGAIDAFVSNPDSYSASPSTHPWLVTGSDGTNLLRSLLRFDLSAIPTGPTVAVTEAHLNLVNWYTYGYSCTPGTASLYGLGAAFDASTRWATQPALSAAAPVSKTFAHNNNAGSVCPQATESFDATALTKTWIEGGAPNYGMSLRAGTSTATETALGNFKAFYSAEGTPAGQVPPTLAITWNHLPPVSVPTAPANGVTLSSPTPTLTSTAVTDADGEAVSYWFRIGTGPNVEGSHNIDSGWLTSPTWTVPPGALRDGSYRWHVFTSDGVNYGYLTTPGPTQQAEFRIAQRLGSGGPAPGDAIGPVRVNLATGNLAFGHAGPSLPAVGGSAGVSLAYNSLAPVNGLTGSYFVDPGNHVFPTSPVFTRNDPSVAFSWGTDTAPGPGIGTDGYMVRWDGGLTVPITGTYTFYVGATTDGVRVFINGTKVLERWSEGGSVADSISNLNSTLTAGVPVPIRVEYFEGTGAAGLTLAANAPVVTNGPPSKAVMVEPAWLTGDPGPLPSGFTLGAGSALAYVGARIFEHGVTLTDASGGLHTYAWTGSGYAPPPGEDGVLARNPDNTITLAADDGVTYVFDTQGQLTSATASDDDGAVAGIRYEFSTLANVPRRLQRLRDPVGNRALTLRYGNFDATALPCPAVPAGFAAVPNNQLCQVDYWDGTATILRYNSAGQLTRIEDPGGATWDLAYNAAGKLLKLRDPLAFDAVAATAATGVPDDDDSRTVIAYEAAAPFRATSVTLPVPNSGAPSELPRPAHTFEYPSATETRVRVAGLTGATDEPNGYNRKVIFDSAGRITSDYDATSPPRAPVTFTWDGGDRPTSVTDAANRRSTTIYDADATRAQSTGRVSDTYGPAPAGCFASSGVPNGSCTVPPPHTHTDFDTIAGVAVNGLAMTGWNNTGYQGRPMTRSLATPSGGQLFSGTPAGLPSGSWSARYSGEITLAATGTYGFTVAASGGSAKLFVDDVMVADSAASGGAGTRANTVAGRHRVRVDFSATGASPSLTMTWTPPGGSAQALGAASLFPRWAHATRTQSDDNNSVPPLVRAAVYDSMPRGVVKERWTDPGGLDLVSTAGYEASGLRRPESWTLPAGDMADLDTASVYAYYTDTQADVSACGQAAGINQAGMPRTRTSPSPDATANGRRVNEVLYDAAGRIKASRVNAEDWSCRSYDARGRLTQSTVPAYGGEGGHIFTYNYAVGDNPLVARVTEGTTSMTTKVDLLGRVVSYTDIWNKTTTSAYDQAGRLTDTAGPGGAVHLTYDPAGRVLTQSLDTVLMATAAYDSAGELGSVSYASVLNGGNGTSLAAITRHPTGMTTGLTWTGPAGTLASDLVGRSQSGKVVNETIDGTDVDPSRVNFEYDPAGRLKLARVPGHVLEYKFEPTGNCPQTQPGRNSNRSSLIDTANGTTATTTYCYDNADRLVSSTDPAVGTPAYDSHGNTTTLGTQTLIYDGADRHMETKVNATTLVRYQRDPSGRITSRKEGTDPEVHYGFAGPGDSPGFVMDASNNVIERSMGLLGGVMVTKRGGLLGAGDVWSYPNVHGDVMAVADNNGAKQGATKSYDPFGQSLAGLPDNSAGNLDYGWLGSAQRPIEHAGTLATIEMGARQYVPSLGRLLEVDPVEGGSANDYDYAAGDPVNSYDLDGTEVRGRCTTVEGYGVVGGSVTACDLRDDRGNRTQTISVGGGVGVALSGSTGVYYSNAPTVNDVLGWSECQAGSYGPVSGQLCFFKGGPDRESYFSVYGGLGPGIAGGSISAVRTYRPNGFVRAFIRHVTFTPPKCSWGGGGSWGGRCAFESY